VSEWKFQKAKDVKPDLPDYIGFISDYRMTKHAIYKEFYVPENYLKGKPDE